MLKETVKSLSPQADKIMLFLNKYNDINLCREVKGGNPKVSYVIGDNRYGDAYKFFFCEANELKGYVFTADDDMIYPPDYVTHMIKGIEKYGRKAVVSLHGRTFDFPISSYYGGHKKYYSFRDKVNEDKQADVIGTGCMAWHTDTIQPKMENFPTANMADIHFSILAKKKNLPLMVLAHKMQWVHYMNPPDTIFAQKRKDDSEHVRRLNEVFANKLTDIAQ